MAIKDKETMEVFHRFYDKHVMKTPKKFKVRVEKSEDDRET